MTHIAINLAPNIYFRISKWLSQHKLGVKMTNIKNNLEFNG